MRIQTEKFGFLFWAFYEDTNMQHVSSMLQPFFSLEIPNTPSLNTQCYKPVCFWSLKMLDQRLKFFFKIVCLICIHWFCNHTHKIGNSYPHTFPKNSKKRHWKSTRICQKGSDCKTKLHFKDSQRQCLLRAGVAWAAFTEFLSFKRKNLNCWADFTGWHSVVLPQAATFVCLPISYNWKTIIT